MSKEKQVSFQRFQENNEEKQELEASGTTDSGNSKIQTHDSIRILQFPAIQSDAKTTFSKEKWSNRRLRWWVVGGWWCLTVEKGAGSN